jgi:hypothetical protein
LNGCNILKQQKEPNRIMFKPGSKVQAIDEIGRWEMARILQVFPDMPIDGSSDAVDSPYNYKVRFLGWGDDFDKLVGKEEIRLPLKVHPLGGKWWGPCNLTWATQEDVRPPELGPTIIINTKNS